LTGLGDVRATRTGEITIREIADRYMAEYAGRDTTRPQRLGWWIAKLGGVSLAVLCDDEIHFALLDPAAQRGRFLSGVDADGKPAYKSKRGPLRTATVNRYAAALGALRHSCAGYSRMTAPRCWRSRRCSAEGVSARQTEAVEDEVGNGQDCRGENHGSDDASEYLQEGNLLLKVCP
jgi:hypothetical protein